MITVDGTSYSNLIVSVKRTAKMEASDVSGMLLDRSYFADIIGTYMTYRVDISVPIGEESLYANLYETITDPTGDHSFSNLPYNQGVLNVTGRIENISDSYYRMEDTKRIWRKISFDIISNYPTKYYSLGDAVELGTHVPPDVQNPVEGQAYIYENSTWVELNYTDVDEVYY